MTYAPQSGIEGWGDLVVKGEYTNQANQTQVLSRTSSIKYSGVNIANALQYVRGDLLATTMVTDSKDYQLVEIRNVSTRYAATLAVNYTPSQNSGLSLSTLSGYCKNGLELKPNTSCKLVVNHKPTVEYSARKEEVTVKLSHLDGKALSPAPEAKLVFTATASTVPVPNLTVSFGAPTAIPANVLLNERGLLGVPVGNSILFNYTVTNTSSTTTVLIPDFALPAGWVWHGNGCDKAIAPGASCFLQIKRTPNDTAVQKLDDSRIALKYKYAGYGGIWLDAETKLGSNTNLETVGYKEAKYVSNPKSRDLTNVGDKLEFTFYVTGYRPNLNDGWRLYTGHKDAKIDANQDKSCHLTTLRSQVSQTCTGTVTRATKSRPSGKVAFNAGYTKDGLPAGVHDWNMYLNMITNDPVKPEFQLIVANSVPAWKDCASGVCKVPLGGQSYLAFNHELTARRGDVKNRYFKVISPQTYPYMNRIAQGDLSRLEVQLNDGEYVRFDNNGYGGPTQAGYRWRILFNDACSRNTMINYGLGIAVTVTGSTNDAYTGDPEQTYDVNVIGPKVVFTCDIAKPE